ncbi:hypothetical protein [Sphingopyxis sp. PET50]|uniref:hypothetical protein n=1 Tax=Sphingopyxis sp. PET50 TaxID=2976533 RepID=UPI0021AF84B7|nr:hypothetical protein [Sphingopyxis sp. PET50]
MVEIGARGSKRGLSATIFRGPYPCLCDQLVVGVKGLVAGLPCLLATKIEQRFGIAPVALGQFGQRNPEGRLLPIARVPDALVRRRHRRPIAAIGELPVGDAAGVGHDFRRARHLRFRLNYDGGRRNEHQRR